MVHPQKKKYSQQYAHYIKKYPVCMLTFQPEGGARGMARMWSSSFGEHEWLSNLDCVGLLARQVTKIIRNDSRGPWISPASLMVIWPVVDVCCSEPKWQNYWVIWEKVKSLKNTYSSDLNFPASHGWRDWPVRWEINWMDIKQTPTVQPEQHSRWTSDV